MVSRKLLIWIYGGILTIVITIGAFLFFPSSEEAPFVLAPMPKEDLEVAIKDGKQIVDAKKDGYQLVLTPDVEVITREIEPGRVMIVKGNTCEANVSKIDDSEGMTVMEWFEKDKKWQKSDNFLEVRDYSIEKISDIPLEAYITSLNTARFGIEKEILIQGKNGIFSITQSIQDVNCFPIREILNIFQFK